MSTGHFLTYLRTLFLDLRNGILAARRQREMIEVLKERDARYRALRPSVTRVGILVVYPGSDAFGIREGWEFEFPDTSPHAAITYPPTWEDRDGTKRIYGYTLEELKELHARRAEFNVEA